ncbi:protein ABHD14A-like isoform X2 [Ahaetulla prasina]|uniref:protein ABHD14A-like isoform X2 n=1 Tax=Ahaetulla prasina TaxID=499056 RepID=UPI0026490EEB|nr:protein ABHD14A-like isoform X2 [Ahaetulla prasina]
MRALPSGPGPGEGFAEGSQKKKKKKDLRESLLSLRKFSLQRLKSSVAFLVRACCMSSLFARSARSKGGKKTSLRFLCLRVCGSPGSRGWLPSHAERVAFLQFPRRKGFGLFFFFLHGWPVGRDAGRGSRTGAGQVLGNGRREIKEVDAPLGAKGSSWKCLKHRRLELKDLLGSKRTKTLFFAYFLHNNHSVRLALLVLGILVTFVLYLLLPAIQHEKFTASIDIPKPRAMEEEVKGTGAGNVTIATGTILHSSVFFREAVLVQKDVASSTERLAVIFLHGQSFTSKTWETLGTLALLAENGYRAVAIDLPGYGSSPRSTSVGTAKGRVSFLEQVFKELGLQKPILISSSMSGRYSIPFLFSSGEQLKGFVSIAPVGTKDFTAQQYQQVEIPTLILYGQRDTDLGIQSLQSLQQIPRSRVVMLLGAGHACYLDKPQEFHKALLSFLGELK